MKVTRPQWIRFLNYLLYLTFCAITGTGLLLVWRLPRGPQGRGIELFDFTRHEWADIHLWLGYLFLALVLAHLGLHLKWLWTVAARKSSLKIILSLLVGVALIATLLLAPLHNTNDSDKSKDRSPQKHHQQ
jgi:hypothetical protein